MPITASGLAPSIADIPARQSILLRYAPLLRRLGYLSGLTNADLETASISEGVSLYHLAMYQEV